MSNLPWSEKYRPKKFDELISQQNVIRIISNMIKNDKFPHLLFYGESGTGKTTTAHICARMLYGDNYKHMIAEFNGSDDRGIGVVRNIKKYVSTSQFFSDKIKIVILDEADSMTPEAQFALRRTIEKYTLNARFIFICNYVDKIIPAICARCMQFRFKPLENRLIMDKMIEICNLEKLNYKKNGLNTIIKLTDSDMRKCYNLLQSIAMSYDVINENNVYDCTGTPSHQLINSILDKLMSDEKLDIVYNYIMKIINENGYTLSDLIKLITEELINLKIEQHKLSSLLIDLANIETRLEQNQCSNIQLAGFVGAFFKIKINE
jgi:replication factor C subunit 3/5